MVKNKCKVEFTKKGLEIKGPCARGFLNLSKTLFKASRTIGREISIYACVDPKAGAIKKVILGKIGTSTSTALPHGRVCSDDERQAVLHTHPVSGKPKFSDTDAVTITNRMNEGTDDLSCVVGEEATQCFLRTLTPKKNTRTKRY